MKPTTTYTIALALLAVTAACAPEGAQRPGDDRAREVQPYTAEQFLETTQFFGSSFSPDGQKILVSSDESGIFNAYAIPVAGGEPERLTHSTDQTIRAQRYFPDDERFLYAADQGGDELDHIYVRELDGSATDLTPGEGHRATFFGWADDDGSFFIGTTERDAKFDDIYEVQRDGYAREMIFQDDVGYDFGGVSPDKRFLALVKTETTTESDIFLYDRETGEMRNLTGDNLEAENSPQDFSPDGRFLYFTSDQEAEFDYLARLDLETGDRERVLEPGWDVWFARFSDDGTYLTVGMNEDARTRIRVFEMPGMREVELPEMSGLDVTSATFSDDEALLALYAGSSRSPLDLYVYQLGTDAPRQLTNSLSPEIDADDLVEGQVVRFASYDGVEIPGVLYRPHRASVEKPVPALVWVHGGPGGQSRLGYSALIQYLLNHGYAIYAINNRGSSGYGKSFFKLDDRKHGEADLQDCIASKEMLIETGWIDPQRIGIAGGSYGGYMVLAALTLAPEEFAVGVDLFGISNWVRTLESIPSWWESFREALYRELGDPTEDRERLERISPILHANRIRRPLMVLQGANDPRVLQVESDEIVKAARENGVPVEYVLFEDEGHGFTKKENRIAGYEKIREFLDRYLLEMPLPAGYAQDEAANGTDRSSTTNGGTP